MSALPDGHLACLACGVAAEPVGPVVWATSMGREGTPPTVASQESRTGFTTCPACAALDVRAAALVAANPRLARQIGDERTAAYRVVCALYALAVLHGPDAAVAAEHELGLLLRHLTVPGAQARWLARFSPVMTADASPTTCSPAPWAHVQDKQGLHTGYGAVLRERTAAAAPPVDLAPPGPLAGCLMCGVGSLRVPAVAVARAGGYEAATRAVWTAKRARPESLGGRPEPQPVSGDLCPACCDAAEQSGALGWQALERAVAEHLRRTGQAEQARRLRADSPGIVAWAVSGRQEPNGTPWEHLGALLDRL